MCSNSTVKHYIYFRRKKECKTIDKNVVTALRPSIRPASARESSVRATPLPRFIVPRAMSVWIDYNYIL